MKIDLNLEEKKLLDCIMDPIAGEEKGWTNREDLLDWVKMVGTCYGCKEFCTVKRCPHLATKRRLMKKVRSLPDGRVYFNIFYDGIYLP